MKKAKLFVLTLLLILAICMVSDHVGGGRGWDQVNDVASISNSAWASPFQPLPVGAAPKGVDPAAVSEVPGNGPQRSDTYSTAERDVYNYAHLRLSDMTFQIERRSALPSAKPDDISILYHQVPIWELPAEWGEEPVQGRYYGYDMAWDVSEWQNGEYSIVINSNATMVDTAGEGIVCSPYTLASVSFVKEDSDCYFSVGGTLANRYNSNLLQQLEGGKAPNDFAMLTEYYSQERDGQMLQEIEAKVNQLTAGLSSDEEKCAAIYQWIVYNISYDFDFPRDQMDQWLKDHPQDSPRLDNPLYAYEQGYAMCYGYAKLNTLMLGYAGLDSVYIKGLCETDVCAVLGDTVNADEYNHAWNAVNISGSWYFVDTCKDAMYGYYRLEKNNPLTGYVKMNKIPSYSYIFPSLNQISNTHIALRYGVERNGKILNDYKVVA